MRLRTLAAGVLVACSAPALAAADWTPHAAAALLDSTFPSAEACQHALDDARQRETHAAPVHGLSYTHLFEQGRCQTSLHKATRVWRIRMHWTRGPRPPEGH